MKQIAFIGLGTMGHPMAANLLRAGFAVTVYNRHPEKARDLVQQGAQRAESPADASRDADVVILMVSDNAAVRAVVLGPHGVAEGASSGQILIDMSTVSPDVNRELGQTLAAQGVIVLDAPVVGSVKPATDGTLTIIVGGDQAAFEQSMSIFQAMGKQIIHVGPLGTGNHLKLCINLLVGAIMENVAESLVLAERGGINRKTVLDVAGSILLTSPWFHTKLPNFLNDDYPVAFALTHMTKDLGYVMEQARQLCVALPSAAATHENYIAAMNHNLGNLDASAIMRWLEQTAGVKAQ